MLESSQQQFTSALPLIESAKGNINTFRVELNLLTDQGQINMESQDPVLHCLDRLNLGEHSKLRERSQYFYNQCSKVPPKVLSKGINSRPVVSIQLACERYMLQNRNR